MTSEAALLSVLTLASLLFGFVGGDYPVVRVEAAEFPTSGQSFIADHAQTNSGDHADANSAFPDRVDTASGYSATRLPLTLKALVRHWFRVYNTRDAGVRCDGTGDGSGTDVSPALSNLIGHAAVNARDGHRVAIYFPPSQSTCLLSKPMLLPGHVDLIAQPGTVVIAPINGSNAKPALLVELVRTEDNLVYGFIFDGGMGHKLAVNDNRMLLLAGVSEITLEENVFRHSRGIAIEHGGNIGSTHVVIRNNRFADIGNYWQKTGNASDRAAAINFDNVHRHDSYSTDILVAGNLFQGIGLDAIEISSSRHVVVRFNDIINTNGPAQWALQFPDYPDSISGGGSDFVVSGNHIYGSPGMCIALEADNLVIDGNVCNAPGSAGISPKGAHVVVSNNLIKDPVQLAEPTQDAGITLFGQTIDAWITANTIVDTHTQYGQVIKGQATITGLATTSQLKVGDLVVSSDFAPNTSIVSIDSATQVSASGNAMRSSQHERVVFGRPTMPFCYQGIGPNHIASSGRLADIYIDRTNTCEGPRIAPFQPAMGYNLHLQYGKNY